MITQIFSKNVIKILTMFSLSPGSKFNRKKIQELIKLNNVPLDRALMILISSNILIREKNFYLLNFELEHTKIIVYMCLKEFKKFKDIPLGVYYILMDVVDFLSLKKGIEAFLFGSYVKLVYTNKSDIDIAILYENDFNIKDINDFVLKLEGIYDKSIEIQDFEKKSFYKNKKDPIVNSILRDGIRLI